MLYQNDLIKALEALDPDKVLLVGQRERLTARDLYDSSMQLALNLAKAGVKRSDRIALAVTPDIHFIWIVYACMMLRTVISIIDPEMGPENYRAKLAQFRPNAVFVDSRLLFLAEHPVLRFLLRKWVDHLPDMRNLKDSMVISVGGRMPIWRRHLRYERLLTGTLPLVTLQDADPEDDVLVTYTSGTLAEPKGVVHSYRSLAASIRALGRLVTSRGDTSMATHLPTFVLLGITTGLQVFLWNARWGAKKKMDFIRKHRITTLFGPPSDFLPLVRASGSFPLSLKNIYLGSAPVYPAFLNSLAGHGEHFGITCLYGMTEHLMTTWVDGRIKRHWSGTGDLLGKTFPGVGISTIDGELHVQSDQLFSRYWHMTNGPVFHPTGDLGQVDQQGQVTLHGRKKDMIIRRNFNIYPGLYEPVIHRIPGISEAVMVGVYVEDQADEEVVLVVETHGKLREKTILDKLRFGPCSIDQEAIPDRVVFMALPRSGRQNKVDRKAIRESLQLSRQ